MRGKLRLESPHAGVVATIVADVLLTSTLAPFHDDIGLLNEGLAFLLLTLLISSRWGWQVGLLSAASSNLTLNFFFVEPLHQFTVQEPSNVFGLVVFLVVSVVGGSLLSAAQSAAAEARRRAAETEVLLRLSRAMIGQTEPADALSALCTQVIEAFQAPGAAVLGAPGPWHVHAWAGTREAARPPDAAERVMAERATDSGVISRLGHTGLSRARRPRIISPSRSQGDGEARRGVAFVPLAIGGRTLGVLRLDGPIGEAEFRDDPDRLLRAFASEAALGVHRAELAQEAAHAAALRQADELKSALMTSISHDLKTPLAGIKTSVSSLLDESVAWSPDDRRAFLGTIDSQTDRLNRVISDILDLTRIESGTVTPAKGAILVRGVLEEAKARAALATAGRAVTVDAGTEMLVLADEALIVQAVVNLIENAAKYSTAGGAIRLTARRAGAAGIELAVSDAGPGIARQDLPHVFERFYRAHEHSRRVKGSGLGLAIVKGFVTLTGGTVAVESSPEGTTFTIRLPAAERPAVAV